MARPCIHCGADISARHYLAKQCLDCYSSAQRRTGKAAPTMTPTSKRTKPHTVPLTPEEILRMSAQHWYRKGGVRNFDVVGFAQHIARGYGIATYRRPCIDVAAPVQQETA